MGDNKLLVAVTIIERNLHDCRFVECEEKFPHNEIDTHERVCKHRVLVPIPYVFSHTMFPKVLKTMSFMDN